MRGGSGFLNCVRHGDRQSNSSHDGYVCEVVTDISTFRGLHPRVAQHLVKCFQLLANRLAHIINLQLMTTTLDRARATARDEACLQAGAMKQSNTLTVVYIESLMLVAVVRQPDATVSQYAVAVHEQQPDPSSSFLQIGRFEFHASGWFRV